MNEFVRMLRMYRFLWIGGRFGGGKTTLALALADRLIAQRSQRYVASNLPLYVDAPFRITRDIGEVTKLEDTVILMDESGMILDQGASPKSLKAWFAYLRKSNQVILLASVLPVARFATQFRCQRVFNGSQMGIPGWLYKWHLGIGDTKDSGWFIWWLPSRVFGLYDTDYRPSDEWWIYDFQNDGSTGSGISTEVEQYLQTEFEAA